MTDSVAFDRAAEYYDRTRALSPAATEENVAVLSAELTGRGRVLEVGVGTGLLALPLSARGIPIVGIDLSGPMVAQLVGKSGGRAPFPVALADATRLPFPDGALGGAYLRWVLHLIPSWRSALAEMDRVVGSRGPLLVNLGGYGGIRAEVQDRFAEITGLPHDPIGLGWGDTESLDRAMAELGRHPRALPPIHDTAVETIGEFLRGIEENRFSWTWRMPDDVRARGLTELRRWAAERWDDLDEPRTVAFDTQWRAFDRS